MANFEQEVLKVLASNNVTVNADYTLPTEDGTAGQRLTTDGSGNLTWETP